MGEAKRRGTFEQRKATKIASQYGLTNHQIEEAYLMNRRYNLNKIKRKNSNIFNMVEFLLNSFK